MMTRALVRAGLLLCGVLECAPVFAGGVVLTVTRTDDPAPDTCTPTDCSLREAVLAADAAGNGLDEIHLAAATYHVGAPTIMATGVLSIIGAGSGQTHIEGDGGQAVMQLVGNRLALSGLSIDAHGSTELYVAGSADFTDISALNPLGAIVVSNGSFATLARSEIRTEMSFSDTDHVEVSDTRLVNLSISTSSTGINFVDLLRVTIDGELAPGVVSRLDLHSSGSSNTMLADVSDVIVQHTTAGAEFSASGADMQVEIARMRYLDNSEPVHVWGTPQITIHDSTFSDNRHTDIATPRPGALWLRVGESNVEVLRSTFDSNRGTSPVGGAVLVDGGATLALRNSTFVDNIIDAGVAAGGARGAAIGYRAHDNLTTLVMQHLTIVGPTIMPVGLSGTALGGEGNDTGLAMTMRNSIVRGTCDLDANALDAAVGNIESGGNSCTFPTLTNQVNILPEALALGSLGMHGGYTPTVLTSATSIALDAANEGGCLDEDQRGYARPVGVGCDVGAVERVDVIFANGFN
jgi:CSLREA domain-containing protein